MLLLNNFYIIQISVSGETETKFLAKLPKLAKPVSPYMQISETGETSETWRNLRNLAKPSKLGETSFIVIFRKHNCYFLITCNITTKNALKFDITYHQLF